MFSLLRALSLLQAPERFTLTLAGGYGDQAEYDAIRALAAEAPCPVLFPGKLSQAELAREMNESDVFVLPSFYEGLPLVLIEAMACGLNCVCTDLPGIRPWLDARLPGHGVVFVAPPAMHNQDEPEPKVSRALSGSLPRPSLPRSPPRGPRRRLSPPCPGRGSAERFCRCCSEIPKRSGNPGNFFLTNEKKKREACIIALAFSGIV